MNFMSVLVGKMYESIGFQGVIGAGLVALGFTVFPCSRLAAPARFPCCVVR
ncbi:hypothetical protein ACNKHR_05950 [Shigella flexneri]